MSIFITLRDIPPKNQVLCQPPHQEERMHPLEAHRAHQAEGSSWCAGQPGWQVSQPAIFDDTMISVPDVLQKFTGASTINSRMDIQCQFWCRYYLQYKIRLISGRKGRQRHKWCLCHIQWNQDFIWNTKRMNCTCWGKAQGQNQGHLIPLFLTFLRVQVIQIQLLWVSHALMTEH